MSSPRQFRRYFEVGIFDSKKILASLEAAQRVLHRAIRDETPRFRGTLRKAWTKQPAVEAGTEFYAEVTNDLIYARPQNYGTRPPHGPYGRQGIENVTKWAQKKLRMNKKQARSFAFAYRNTLVKKGMLTRLGGKKGTEFLESACDKAENDVWDAFAKRLFK